MTKSADERAAPWIPLLVTGISLNTLGITLFNSGWIRYAFMAAGLAMILTAVVKMLATARRDPK
jgi:predicted phage tail protein